LSRLYALLLNVSDFAVLVPLLFFTFNVTEPVNVSAITEYYAVAFVTSLVIDVAALTSPGIL
jgi:hypothetical protein